MKCCHEGPKIFWYKNEVICGRCRKKRNVNFKVKYLCVTCKEKGARLCCASHGEDIQPYCNDCRQVHSECKQKDDKLSEGFSSRDHPWIVESLEGDLESMNKAVDANEKLLKKILKKYKDAKANLEREIEVTSKIIASLKKGTVNLFRDDQFDDEFESLLRSHIGRDRLTIPKPYSLFEDIMSTVENDHDFSAKFSDYLETLEHIIDLRMTLERENEEHNNYIKEIENGHRERIDKIMKSATENATSCPGISKCIEKIEDIAGDEKKIIKELKRDNKSLIRMVMDSTKHSPQSLQDIHSLIGDRLCRQCMDGDSSPSIFDGTISSTIGSHQEMKVTEINGQVLLFINKEAMFIYHMPSFQISKRRNLRYLYVSTLYQFKNYLYFCALEDSNKSEEVKGDGDTGFSWQIMKISTETLKVQLHCTIQGLSRDAKPILIGSDNYCVIYQTNSNEYMCLEIENRTIVQGLFYGDRKHIVIYRNNELFEAKISDDDNLPIGAPKEYFGYVYIPTEYGIMKLNQSQFVRSRPRITAE